MTVLTTYNLFLDVFPVVFVVSLVNMIEKDLSPLLTIAILVLDLLLRIDSIV